MRRLFFILAVMLLLVGAAHAQEAAVSPMVAFLRANNAVPCFSADEPWQCVDLTVPLDHTDPANPAAIDITFAIIPAAVEASQRRGMFVTVTGGPGYSGLAASTSYASYFYPELFTAYDIVFFDQRGIGRSEGVRCDEEALAYYTADTTDPEGLIDAAQTFAQACIAAIGRPDLLPYLGTTQAIEDLELFRAAVGDETFMLYGESYGTQFAQTYAAAYPQHIAGLILDGVVDLTLTSPEYYRGQDQAFIDAGREAFAACAADPVCAGDFPNGDPAAYYADLTSALAGTPQTFTFPLPNGASETRTLTRAMLDAAYSAAMYGPDTRSQFVSAVAAHAGGNPILLARLAYSALYLDSGSLTLVPDEGWSDASYYAIECNDYVYEITQSDPVCYFWDVARPPQQRPAPLTIDAPVLILNATIDPATPVQNGYDVAARLPNAHSITMDAGWHVIYGRGGTCPDDAVTSFLMTGALPAGESSTCDGDVLTPYIPYQPQGLAEQEALALLVNFDQRRELAPEYFYWSGESAFSFGCDFGGTISYAPSGVGEAWTLTGCGITPDIRLDGTAALDYTSEILTAVLTATEAGQNIGTLTYTRYGLYATDATRPPAQVTGFWRGESVSQGQ
jgi:pimeloyl-ACP methyl ester carboxylesterase